MSNDILHMTDYWYPTAFNSWGDEEIAAIDRVVRAGRFTMGEEVAVFEREFANAHGRRYGIMVNSGSSANMVAVSALVNRGDLKPGDKVVVPALAWSTTYAPLVQHGMDLVLSDCDETWNAVHVNLNDPDPAAIVVCSILGNPGYLHEWSEYSGVHNIPMIEDNCESIWASIPSDAEPHGKLCGTFGILSTFSFFWSHQLSAIEGGMILTNDQELAELCRILRAHGWTRDVKPPSRFEDEYDFQLFGYNVRPLEMHAAVAREQLKKLPQQVKCRRDNYFRFWAKAEHVLGHGHDPDKDLPIDGMRPGGLLSPFCIPFKARDQETRRQLVLALRSAGIDCRLPTGGSFRLHKYGQRWHDQQTPVADDIHRTGLFLGSAPYPIMDRIELAVEIIRDVVTARSAAL